MKKMLKKFIHKFIVDERGAVSIFLIMILILLFLFNAVLIDFARIMIADRQTEEAAKVAIRSTMSSYHQDLQDTGLFAYDGDAAEATAVFKEVFETNISPNEHGNFDMLGLQLEESELSVDLNLERSLVNRDILRYQILEEMKYKAPVEVGEAIIKNFLSISEKVEEASNYSKVAKEVNELSKDLQAKLEEAKEKVESTITTLDNINHYISHQGPTGTYPDVKTSYDIYHYHNRYKQDLESIKEADEATGEEAEEIDEDDIEEKRDNTRIYKAESKRILNEILTAANTSYDYLVEATDLVDEAKEINDEIKEKINNPETSTGDDYSNAKDLAEQNVDGSISDSTLDDFILEDSFFENIKEKLRNSRLGLAVESGSATHSLIPKIEVDFLPDVENDFVGASHRSIERHASLTDQYYRDSKTQSGEANDAIDEALSDYLSVDGQTKDEVEEEIENDEEEADEEMGNIQEDFEELEEQIGESIDDSEIIAALNAKAAEYGDASAANQQEFSLEDRDDTTEQSMSFIDVIFKGIGDLLVGARDEVYVNEYILMRFKSHNFKNEGADAYSYKNNQVEYMIYGLPGYGVNHFAAMSEIFAVRFAIQFTAALLSPETKLFGPLIWAASLKKAFVETAKDMNQIRQGKDVWLFPRVRALGSMDYQDHLRLFLFIHPEGGKFHRLMAVLNKETGAELDEIPTYVTAEATTSIRLWFLPQVADILGNAGIIDGRVEDNRYYIEKEVNFSY